MKRIFPGQLEPTFNIECGMCKRHRIETITDSRGGGSAQTKTAARQILESLRWTRTRAWGWICPRCNLYGDSSIIPTPAPTGGPTT
jgi:hypothetical protein